MPNIYLTDEEVAALRIEFFPRMRVASAVAANPLVAQALYKLDPGALPWTARDDIEQGRI